MAGLMTRPEVGVMAKKKGPGRPRKADGLSVQVRIVRSIAKKARVVADDRGVDLVDYLSGLLESPVDRDYRQFLKKGDIDK